MPAPDGSIPAEDRAFVVRVRMGDDAVVARPAPAAPSPLRILLVEDNVVNQKVATEMLRRLGHRADVAGDGARAVAMVAERAFDLVLMDVQMPILDGLTATRLIRARGGKQPRIVGLTADAFAETRRRCLAAGMDEFLAKPVRLDAVAELLARCTPRGSEDDAAAR